MGLHLARFRIILNLLLTVDGSNGSSTSFVGEGNNHIDVDLLCSSFKISTTGAGMIIFLIDDLVFGGEIKIRFHNRPTLRPPHYSRTPAP